MDETRFKGTISFIHHAKKNAMIDYEQAGKKKTVSFKTELSKEEKSKKTHQYRIGDEVNFKVKLNDRGDRMMAYDIKFLYNTSLEKLVQRSAIENNFRGYLKVVDEDYYVKEIESYLFFPLQLSKWETPPPESVFNEAVDFKLHDLDKPNSISAELFTHDFIPEFKKAQHHLKSKTPTEAIVSRISPYAIYVQLFGDKMEAKLDKGAADAVPLKEGDTVKVIITYLTGSKIVIEQVQTA